MAHVQRKGKGRWQARYRGPDGRERTRMHRRRIDAERWLTAQEHQMDRGDWLDPSRGSLTLDRWAAGWLATRGDLRTTTRARLESIMRLHVLPEFGSRRLRSLTNAEVHRWVAAMTDDGMSAASVRKSLFALRQMLDAAVADRRLSVNPAASVPLPAEHAAEQRFLTQAQVGDLADVMPDQYRALVLVAAYGGLRWGELAGLRRGRVDTLRGRITVAETAVDVGRDITFGPPKTAKSRRVVPLARSVMRDLDEHMASHTGPDADALVFTSATGLPLRRGTFRTTWRAATRAAGCRELRFHDLRHTFVAVMVAAGANPKAVSTWAGHSSVAFTLDRYGHLMEGHDDDVSDRLDVLLSTARSESASVARIGATKQQSNRKERSS